MGYLQKIITAFELHSVDEIKECFENGIDPNTTVNGKPLIYELINMYSRGPLFKTCIQTFIDYGLEFEDKILLAVLLDNARMLDIQLANKKDVISKKYSFACTFTPLNDVTLLRICAEYNHMECAELLLNRGADINAIAGFDENGFGGQTAIFHTVNQYLNNSIDVLKLLISRKADLNITVNGLIWS